MLHYSHLLTFLQYHQMITKPGLHLHQFYITMLPNDVNLTSIWQKTVTFWQCWIYAMWQPFGNVGFSSGNVAFKSFGNLLAMLNFSCFCYLLAMLKVTCFCTKIGVKFTSTLHNNVAKCCKSEVSLTKNGDLVAMLNLSHLAAI